MIIAGVRFVDMGLKAWVFTAAEEEQRINFKQPPFPYPLERVSRDGERADLTAEEKEQLRQIVRDYKNWQAEREKIDPILAQRQRTAANSLAMLIIGLPLYLYHWRLASKRKEEE